MSGFFWNRACQQAREPRPGAQPEEPAAEVIALYSSPCQGISHTDRCSSVFIGGCHSFEPQIHRMHTGTGSSAILSSSPLFSALIFSAGTENTAGFLKAGMRVPWRYHLITVCILCVRSSKAIHPPIHTEKHRFKRVIPFVHCVASSMVVSLGPEPGNFRRRFHHLGPCPSR